MLKLRTMVLVGAATPSNLLSFDLPNMAVGGIVSQHRGYSADCGSPLPRGFPSMAMSS
ncbi:MAG: hypothetical protein Q4B65_02355 [Candidatus Saccharibacteria bacterium]|nr:hypothetical protein [Candidatus Saccharibacteria bacterium]